jgi:ubiquinone biosynthesis O-methyltransferase
MEVIEHVDNPLKFVSDMEKSVKDGGLVMLSTIRRSFSTWFTHILVAEKIIGMVPSGTHHHEKFINPDECEYFLKSNGLEPLVTLELDLNWKG